MSNREQIVVNQLGYRPQDNKLAVIEGEEGLFQIINYATGSVVWEGMSSAIIDDEPSGARVSRLNFTALAEPGEYYIKGSSGQSIAFKIEDGLYNDVHTAVLKAFYYLRCGIELEQKYAGDYKHGPCHCTPVYIYGDEQKRTIEANGGWHDAGDYGKYIVAAGKAIADMLLAYEWYPQAFKAKVPLPESNDQMDDLLHEVKFELDWMLKMQEPQSGGVYHKLTTLQFPPLDIMPEDDTADLYAMPISGTATASFAATLAMASRIYRKVDKPYSEKLLAAAKKAWQWLIEHPVVEGFKNPSDVGTGEYGDASDLDERYWAAIELYRVTGDASYHEEFKRLAANDEIIKEALGWVNMGGYGTISYLYCEQPTDPQLKEKLHHVIIEHAEQLVAHSREDGYSISLTADQYQWGSNMDVMNHAMILLIAQHLEGHKHYQEIIDAHIHYLLGMNINGYSYISGYGHRAMANPHHRPSVADHVEAPVPGMVSGGPNKNLQDEYVQQHLQGCAPAACFVDHIESYSTNEITIYWNSPALFVLSAFVS